jgi:hypothetical protein
VRNASIFISEFHWIPAPSVVESVRNEALHLGHDETRPTESDWRHSSLLHNSK